MFFQAELKAALFMQLARGVFTVNILPVTRTWQSLAGMTVGANLVSYASI